MEFLFKHKSDARRTLMTNAAPVGFGGSRLRDDYRLVAYSWTIT
jgi:hypothetical protein